MGSRHSDEAIGDRYELPSERAYSETCAAIAVMQWAWRMFLATGGAKYLDVFERVLYNAYAVGLSADGKAFFYDNPLQRRPDHEQRSGAEDGGEPLRRAWFGCPCCPPNIVRWMAQLADYLAAERDGALLVASYASARIESAGLGLAMETAYPWDGDVRLTVERAADGPYALVLRIPGWARGATVTVNGEPHAGDPEDGWLAVERRWSAGDEVRLTLPMPVRAHGSHPYLDATRGAVAVARGPLVYCVEQQDSPAAAVDDLVVGVPEIVNANIERRDGTVVLGVTACAAPPPPAELYPELPLEQALPETTVTATFVPYFLWGNRGPEAMRVWVRTPMTTGKKAT
ncbi:glycoside hydrolase family 127 protein [Nonomuraea sp. KM90]|uniref:glycoside hydrolase family 127 protein n=1 Tax=Nonomuraea sp. KM90 TaxID=3457428 RepID=UPI003FCC6677